MNYIKDRSGNLYNEKETITVKLFYGNPLGRSIMKLFALPFFSKFIGLILSSKISKIFIPSFIKNNSINMNLFEEEDYKSFNDFFIRKRKEIIVDKTNNTLISPASSKLLISKITNEGVYKVKNTNYTISDLLNNDPIYKEYIGGDILIFRLCKDDYHRYHFIDNGKIIKSTFINGMLNTVRPIAIRKSKVFKRNARNYTIISTSNFGDVIYIEVGATLVGKIVNHQSEGYGFTKGEEKGYFKFGGSTILLMFKKGIIKIDDDIVNNSKEDIETIVNACEIIGKRK